MFKVADERFDQPKDFSLDDFMRHSFQVMHDDLYTVKVRVSPSWARWVEEKIWHESQKITELPNGSLEITFRVAGLEEIERWVLSLGPECQVLEPEKLRDIVRKDLFKTMAQEPASRVAVNLMRESRAI